MADGKDSTYGIQEKDSMCSIQRKEQNKAIELKDVCINYRILNATSVQKSLFHKIVFSV